ncbi:UNVERIFIED_CONTAM: hypothetical protein HDU68_008279 [Siphonaria sp. JEL0065]|nr:hypothetical protein HDU68_008279 [Siphonaria sp. JEL0065]
MASDPQPKPVTVFVTVSDGKTVIITISKHATIAELKMAVENEIKDEEPGALTKGSVMSGGKKWPDSTQLAEIDGSTKGVIKVSLALLSVNTAKKYDILVFMHANLIVTYPRPIVVVRKSREGNQLSCHTCFKPTTSSCVTCGKHLCASCMQFKDSDAADPEGRKRRVTFSENTSIAMECPACAQNRADSPVASPLSPMIVSVKNHWQSNKCQPTKLNDLCQVNYTKIEQCGTGAVHCAIIDSIYKDVPLSKVKFNAKQEYEYVTNYKILQAAFDKHKIDNAIPVERLMKCKFQDNIEFMQWLKKYWDQYYPGGPYDAAGRRGGSAVAATSYKAAASPIKKMAGAAPANANRSAIAPAAFGAAVASSKGSAVAPAAEYQKKLLEMTQHAEELKDTVGQVEKERDFYFAKLREIEMFVSGQLEENGVANKEALTFIQNIMYKTEDGFEPPVATEETF